MVITLANNATLFVYDGIQVENELAQLQRLEDFVYVNYGITLAELQSEKSDLVADLNLTINILGGFDDEDGGPPMGIPSFLWGCCFGIVGVAIVYFAADNKSETRGAVIGCIISNLLGIGCLVLYYVLVVYYAVSWWYW